MPPYSVDPPDLPAPAEILKTIEELRSEHRLLEESLTRQQERPMPDQLLIQRLKRRKLAVKDHLARLESDLLPDIIA